MKGYCCCCTIGSEPLVVVDGTPTVPEGFVAADVLLLDDCRDGMTVGGCCGG